MAVVVLQDIGRLKLIEQATIEASRLKSEFITTMSRTFTLNVMPLIPFICKMPNSYPSLYLDELRTPLNGILGATSTVDHWLEGCQGNSGALNFSELRESMSIVSHQKPFTVMPGKN